MKEELKGRLFNREFSVYLFTFPIFQTVWLLDSHVSDGFLPSKEYSRGKKFSAQISAEKMKERFVYYFSFKTYVYLISLGQSQKLFDPML